MASITTKSTKAEILAAYKALQATPTTAEDVLVWGQAKASTIAKEARLLVEDCYNLGRWCRMVYTEVVGALFRPIFKS